MPAVFNKHHRNAPNKAVYCGRGSPYGNPFVIGVDGDRDQVCDRFEREILPTLDVSALRGKDLICYCAPARCHCDAILKKANALTVTANPFGWSDEYLARMVALIGPAVAYDIEVLPNVFTLNAESLDKDDNYTFEISDRRNDLDLLLQWFDALHAMQMPMIGYNSISYDYAVIHLIWTYRHAVTYQHLYEKSKAIIEYGSRRQEGFSPHTVWQSDRFTPQIDVFKIHHFDNRAKSQSLKGLEFNMRSASVLEGAVDFDKPLPSEQIDSILIPYNRWDVKETKKFALISAEAIAFRREMSSMLTGDVLNFNETKIGKELLIQRLGDNLCFDRSSGRKQPRQTIRSTIPLADVIFPYISFQHPEMNRVLAWMKSQTLTPADIEPGDDDSSGPARVSTKGVFTGVSATIDGFRFDFGTGGIHGSVLARKYEADDEWHIDDIDVTGLYPSIAIKNRLYPQHLGEQFITEYGKLPEERAKYKKGTTQNAAIKLGQNGAYGDSNNPYSPLYDPKFTMTITINGQLMLCMLAERLMRVPTLQMIQINTDGMTYRIHHTMREHAWAIQAEWERFTLLQLERTAYRRMWVRDVNNYVGQSPDGKLKLKGDYWFPDGSKYDGGWTEAISKAGPSAWHKDLGAQIVQRAAVAAMVYGVDPEVFMRAHRDPFDYMLRAKMPRGSQLFIGDREVQRITRYYITHDGGPLRKISPPTGNPGWYKKAQKVSDRDYAAWHAAWGNTWNPEIHTKNQSKHDERETGLQTGWLVSECNRSEEFSFDKLNLGWYLEMTRKLIIG